MASAEKLAAGQGGQGITPGGAVDRSALIAGNRLLGNDDGAAALPDREPRRARERDARGLAKVERGVDARADREIAGDRGRGVAAGDAEPGQVGFVGKDADIAALGGEVRRIAGADEQRPVFGLAV